MRFCDSVLYNACIALQTSIVLYPCILLTTVHMYCKQRIDALRNIDPILNLKDFLLLIKPWSLLQVFIHKVYWRLSDHIDVFLLLAKLD